MRTFRVVIEGRVLQGFAPDEVRRRLAALTGRSEEVAAKLLSGRPTTVKRGIDEATASRYVETLKKIGVAGHLEQETLELDLDSQQIAPPIALTKSSKPVSQVHGRSAPMLSGVLPNVGEGRRGLKTLALGIGIVFVVVLGIISSVRSAIEYQESAKRSSSTDRQAKAMSLTPEQQVQQDRQREREAQLEERKKQFAGQRDSLLKRVKQLNAAGKYADAFQLGSQWQALDPELDTQTDLAREKVAAQNERAEQARKKTSASHKSGICGEIAKLDLLLYDNPRGHEATTNCSYTDERLLITPRRPLPEERMKRFVFLAFVTVGPLANDDYMLPEKTYVGFGSECQMLKTSDAAILNRWARERGDSWLMRAMMYANAAPKVPCPTSLG
jgi:hypothetical protein